MKLRRITYITCSIVLAVAFGSCRKDAYVTDATDKQNQGATFLRLFDGPEKATYFEPFTDVRTVEVFELRRDPNSNASLNTTLTVNLTSTPDSITAYNDANDASLEPIPDNLYTLAQNQPFVKSATGYTVTFAPGEISKEFLVNVDGSKWTDLSIKYAFAFAIDPTAGVSIRSSQKSIISFLGIQNIYQGTYGALGTFTHPTSGPRDINEDKFLSTIDANTNETTVADLGANGYKMWLRVNADNSVTIIPKGASPATLAQDGVNKYDPDKKEYTLNYFYPGAGGNRVITEVLTLK